MLKVFTVSRKIIQRCFWQIKRYRIFTGQGINNGLGIIITNIMTLFICLEWNRHQPGKVQKIFINTECAVFPKTYGSGAARFIIYFYLN